MLGQDGQGQQPSFSSAKRQVVRPVIPGKHLRPLNIRNCILHHITVAQEKLQTKRGTVLVRIHGTKPHCKSSGDNTSGQPRFAPKVPFMNKNNFENVEKTLNIIHFHRIFH